MSKRTVVLLILDGWGIGKKDMTNPLHAARLPAMDGIARDYPAGALEASGMSVGLPWKEEGNSEAGHLTIGAGRIIYQHFPRITMAIKNNDFFKNSALSSAASHAAREKSALHLIGLVSEGNTHASINHLLALIDLGKRHGITKIRIHAFADGKDSEPRSVLNILAKIPFDETVRLASIAGRYYAMDRDKHWDRTEKSYNALIGNAPLATDVRRLVESHYARNLPDEFIEPSCIADPHNAIQNNDAVIFFNFREDNMRQLATPFILPAPRAIAAGFPTAALASPPSILCATMTQYIKESGIAAAFPPIAITNTLGETLSANGKFQLRIAETEKYAHITYFFNGLKNAPLKNEYRVIIPSRSDARPDDHPEMMTGEIASRVMQTIDEGIDFVLANIASPDAIAHTGNFNAAVAAAEVVDAAIGAIAAAARARNAVVVITADHGNIEQMRNPVTGETETKHNTNPVPFHLVANEFKTAKKTPFAGLNEGTVGVLADVAPTILDLFGIPPPAEMTGKTLLGKLA